MAEGASIIYHIFSIISKRVGNFTHHVAQRAQERSFWLRYPWTSGARLEKGETRGNAKGAPEGALGPIERRVASHDEAAFVNRRNERKPALGLS